MTKTPTRAARALFPLRTLRMHTILFEVLLAPSALFLGVVMAYRDTLNELRQ